MRGGLGYWAKPPYGAPPYGPPLCLLLELCEVLALSHHLDVNAFRCDQVGQHSTTTSSSPLVVIPSSHPEWVIYLTSCNPS